MVTVGVSFATTASLALAIVLAVPLLSAVPGAADDDAFAAGSATRWNVGMDRIAPDLDVGDIWQGADVVRVNRALRQLSVVTTTPGFAASVHNDPNVIFVEPDRIEAWLTHAPNDPRFVEQYAPVRIDANLAWDTTLGTPTKNVCIVDTGVRGTHEDLAGARWLGGYDFVNNDPLPDDDNGHGTHVAGIAAATTDNGKGIAGIAQVGIKAAKVLGASGSGSHANVADGIQWCADNEGHVINLSLGGSASATLQASVEYAWAAGSLIVASAGNNGPCSNCVGFPAAYPESVAVSCTTATDAQCAFASDGPQVDIAAPGNGILSTCAGSDTQYCIMSGTSMSTPNVAGVAALAWSVVPWATNVEVRAALEDSAKDLGAPGWDPLFGWGLANANATLLTLSETALFTQDFDDGTADGWNLTGLWHIDDRCTTPPSGPNYLGYHLGLLCMYQELAPTTGGATFHVDLAQATRATLTFQHRWVTETTQPPTARDEMKVQVSTDDGTTWTTLQKWDSTDANQPDWAPHNVSLDAYAGTEVMVRFHFDSKNILFNHYEGWFIDDVRVLAEGAAS